MFIVFLRMCSIFLMIGLGWLARRFNVVDGATTNRLARLLMFFIYPALIFSSLVRNFTLQTLGTQWLLPLGSLGIMTTGFVIGLLLLLAFGGRQTSQGRAFHFQATINNYSFLVMPLAYFYWGETGVANVVFSTLGGEIAMWTLGVFAISRNGLSRASLKPLLSPPMLAIAAALLVIIGRDLIGWTLPAPATAAVADGGGAALWGALLEGLALFGGATIPLAMIVAGSRIADLDAQHVVHLRQLRVVLVRLILVPAAAIGWILWLPIPIETANILILIAVMPAAVNSVVVSEIFDGDVEFAAASVLLTHVGCLLTIPLWLALILPG